MECQHFGTKRTAAMEVDEDYRRYRTKLEKQINSPIVDDNTTRKRYTR